MKSIFCKILFAIAINLQPLFSDAQSGYEYISSYESIIPVTPNASGLGQYGQLPVDHSTGLPQISIPIFTIQEDGAAVPISISYHASGVKVDELASPVGLKWSLNAGGGIFRSVREKADEIGWLDPARRGIVDVNWFSNHSPTDIHTHDNLRIHFSLYDHYPDLFNYIIPGYSGDFQFDQSGTIRKAYLDGLRIDKTYTGTDLSFKILDPVGNTYVFNVIRERNDGEVVVGTSEGILLQSQRSYENTGWLLEQIITKNGKTIDFTYEEYQLDYEIPQVSQSITKAPKCANHPTDGDSPVEQAENQLIRAIQEAQEKCGCEGGGDPTTYLEYLTSTSVIRRPINQLVSSIETATVRVDFNYTTDPSLSAWKRKLEVIEITDKVLNRQKSFTLSYDAFTGDRRLKLTGIKEVGFEGHTLPPHRFTYFEGDLPVKGSKSKDHKGYYNGKANSSLVPFSAFAYKELTPIHRARLANRNPDLNYLIRGTLKSVQYPTGGTTEFDYEINCDTVTLGGNINYFQPNAFIDTQIDQPQSVNSGGYHVYRKHFTVTNAPDSVLRLPSGYSSTSTIFTDPNSIGGSLFNVYKIDGLTETPVLSTTGKVIGNDGEVILHDADYILELLISPSDYALLNGSTVEKERVEVDWWEEDPEQIFYVGGLRVKSMKDFDSNDREDPPQSIAPLVTERVFEYDGIVGNPSLIQNKRKNYGDKMIFSDENLILDTDLVKSGYYYQNVSISQQGYGMALRSREIFDGKPYKDKYQGALVSKVVYGENDIPIQRQNFTYAITNVNTLQYWAMGEVDVCYEYIGVDINRNNELGFRDPINRVFSSLAHQLTQEELENYYPVSNDTVKTTKYYTYNANQQITSIETTKSQQGTMREEIRYPNDYPELTHLVSGTKHQVGIPVSKEVQNDEQPIMGQFFELDNNGNTIKDYRYHRGEGTNNSHLNYIPDNYELVNDFRVIDGLPIQVNHTSGVATTYVWSYNKSYPAAKIENATSVEVALALGISEAGLTNFDHTNLSALDALRQSLPSAFVTTYKFKPLVGMIEVIDPNGLKTTYEHDDLGRLKHVLDDDSNLLRSIKYHYYNAN
ncbi:MAG: hypothetical protein AAF693_21310 [Bacteroidota bacterium]